MDPRADQTSQRIWFMMPAPTNPSRPPHPPRPRRPLLNLHPASNTFQALFTLVCGVLGSLTLHRTDWTKHLRRVGELIAPHAWVLGLISGLLFGLFVSGLLLLLWRRPRG